MQRAKLLRRSFFDRDPREVCPELLGKIVVRRHRRKIRAGRIVEVEAYLGAGDLAAHAVAGCTERNSVLFGPPGRAYVYFIYGLHYCLNVSCMKAGDAGSILVRALEPVAGSEEMVQVRGLKNLNFNAVRDLRKLTAGPGRLCQSFDITRARDNGKDMVALKSDLQVLDDGFKAAKILVTRRIGIAKAKEMPLRYVMAGNQFISVRISS